MSTRNPNQMEPIDPDDITVYGFDWRDWLKDGESLTAESWSITPSTDGAVLDPRGTFDDGLTAATLSSAVVGVKYWLTCQATKSTGEKKTRTLFVQCEEA